MYLIQLRLHQIVLIQYDFADNQISCSNLIKIHFREQYKVDHQQEVILMEHN